MSLDTSDDIVGHVITWAQRKKWTSKEQTLTLCGSVVGICLSEVTSVNPWTIKIIPTPRASVSVCGHHNIHCYHRLQFTMCCWILCSALFSWNVCHNTHVRIIIVDLRRLMKGDIVSVEGIPVTLKEFCSQVAKLSQHYDINWTDFQSADTELKAVDIPTAIQVWSVNIISI